MTTPSPVDFAPAPQEEQNVTTKAIKEHAKTFSSLNVDGKSILLVDQLGQVQEPTKLTVSLLGVKAAGKKRLNSEAFIAQGQEKDTGSQPDEILSLKKPRKRCKRHLGAFVNDEEEP